MVKQAVAALSILLLTTAAVAQEGPRQLKPGWNLFSKDQDIQLGKEAAAQVEKQMAVIQNQDLTTYVRRIGEKLAAQPEAGGFPYTFKVVNDKSINAFALPGGPAFVHTGLLAAADNEAQVAGVLAHEISHVALRHGTNRFSRNAERDADLLGTRLMAAAGYNPIEMARFFEKLEAEGGARGPQFLSDHPNPGNRVKAVEAEIRYLPQRSYTTGDAAAFTRVRQIVAALPAPPARPAAQAAGTAAGAPALPDLRPSRGVREYRATGYSFSYPDNWQVVSEAQSPTLTVAPREGVVQSGGGTAIGAGLIAGFQNGRGDLRTDTNELVRQMISSNPGMQVQSTKDARVDGQPALLVTLQSQSPFAGETEIDTVATVERPGGLFYLVLIAPRGALANLQASYNAILGSIRFTK